MDVTTLTTVIRNELMTGGKKVSELELLECINNSNFYSDYNGYVQLSAKRKGAENWANIKNIDIDFDKVFDADETPPFYSGKLWLINREFASFVVNNGETVVNKFSKYFPAEDVMLGTLYPHFKYKNNLKNKFFRLFKRH